MDQIKKMQPVDDCMWMNQATLVKFKNSAAFFERGFTITLQWIELAGVRIYVDDTLPDGIVDSGSWVRNDMYEEGARGSSKLVRHRYQI